MQDLIGKALQIIPSNLRKKLIWGQLLLLISSLVELVGVVSIGPFIGLAVNPEYIGRSDFLQWTYQVAGEPTRAQYLAMFGAFFVVFFILSGLFTLLVQLFMLKIANQLESSLAVSLFEYYIKQDYSYHAANHSSIFISRVGNDVARICNSLILPMLQVNARLISVLVLIGLIFFINWKAALNIGLSLSIAYVFVFFLVNRKLKNNGKILTQVNQEKVIVLNEGLSSIKTTHFYRLISYFCEAFEKTYKDLVEQKISDKLLRDVPYFVIESLAFFLVVILIVSMFSGAPDSSVALSQLAVICMAGYRLIPKCQQVYKALASIKTNQTVLMNLYDDLINSIDNEQEACRREKNYSLKVCDALIEATDIRLFFRENKVLNSVSLSVYPGEVVGIVGVSGSGKSTFLSVLTGLLKPDEGEVFLSKNDFLSADTKSIGYVDSMTFIFNGTIKDNVMLFDEKPCEERLNKAVSVSGLDQVIESLDGGINAYIGSRGDRLSSGQLQRVGFARALYRQPKLLFLDEATNALDYEGQQVLIEKIKRTWPLMGLVVVSHRLDARKNFDKLYQLELGNLNLVGFNEE